MSGHSKWSTIKRQKGKADAARGKVFTKIGREIAVAVKQGGPDPALNFKLRDIISKAKNANMPNDNIQRSIKKASGELGSINYEEIIYEGYGPGGSAVIVETLTDNKNRTAGDVRHIFDKYGGSMGTLGCVSYLFDTKGVIIAERLSEDKDEEVMLLALESGAEDFSALGDVYEIITPPSGIGSAVSQLEAGGLRILSSEAERLPQNEVELTGDNLEKFIKMTDAFDDNDDVQEIYHNALLPDFED